MTRRPTTPDVARTFGAVAESGLLRHDQAREERAARARALTLSTPRPHSRGDAAEVLFDEAPREPEPRAPFDKLRESVLLRTDDRAPPEPRPSLRRTLQRANPYAAWKTGGDETTPLRVASERARAGHERYQKAFEVSPLPSLITDRAGGIRRINESARTLLGFDATLIHHPVERLFELPYPEQLKNGLARIDQEAVQLRLRLGRDARPWVDVHARAISAEDVLWTVSVDSSERETMLARALLDKDEVIERQRQRIEALERESRAKNKFIAVLGHDLRAPLNAVLGWTQLMRRELLDTIGRERALATIERNARTQAMLIEELLDVTRLNEGRLALEISAFDVGLVVRRTIEAALPDATNKDLQLLTRQTCNVTIAGDRARIEQIFTNLVSNAMKFTPAGGSIEVTVTREGGNARIEVRDTGRGIAPEQLPHVFKWLHQGSDSVPTREGIGLGLFIVRRLVELHGGSVRVASEGVGLGATVTVLLPACESGMAPPPSSTVLPDLGELDGIDVLVVDDESDSVELLSRVLATRGARVTSARDASSALAYALPKAPDVIVTDLGLPDMDGYELVRRLRDAHGGKVGIVALTGFAAGDCECSASAGFDERLTKPVDIPRLIRAIQQASRGARARTA